MSMQSSELPDWHSLITKKNEGTPFNPLEQFIYDWEPGGERWDEWRELLAAAINWATQQVAAKPTSRKRPAPAPPNIQRFP